jgi:glutathione S-transferase
VTLNALEEAGLEYQDNVIDTSKGEQKTPEYLAIHPSGKVPALAVDDRIITENASILIYLDATNPAANLLPKAQDAITRAQVYSDLMWCSGTVHPMVRQVRMPVRYTDGDPSGVQAKGVEYVHGVAQQIEQRVAGGAWWYADQWSIVDVYVFWLCTTAASAGFPLDDYPNVQDLIARVQARDSFQRAQAREQAAARAAGIEFR